MTTRTNKKLAGSRNQTTLLCSKGFDKVIWLLNHSVLGEKTKPASKALADAITALIDVLGATELLPFKKIDWSRLKDFDDFQDALFSAGCDGQTARAIRMLIEDAYFTFWFFKEDITKVLDQDRVKEKLQISISATTKARLRRIGDCSELGVSELSEISTRIAVAKTRRRGNRLLDFAKARQIEDLVEEIKSSIQDLQRLFGEGVDLLGISTPDTKTYTDPANLPPDTPLAEVGLKNLGFLNNLLREGVETVLHHAANQALDFFADDHDDD